MIVDNSSSEVVRELADTRGYRYIDPGRNLGFAAGVNRGIKEIGTPHPDILLLNPDAAISGEDVVALQRCLHENSNERVACVSPRLIDDDGHPIRVLWPFPSPRQAWIDAAGLARFQSSAGFLIGPVLLLRHEALEAVGLFDEGFFLYAEEADWQRRAAALGWSNHLCAAVCARHAGGATSDDSTTREALFHASVERYVRKWFGRGGWTIFRLGVMAGALVRAMTGPGRAGHRNRFLRYLHGPIRVSSSALS